MVKDKRYYVVFDQVTDQVTIFTTKVDAARAAGCSDETLSRAEKSGNHYQSKRALVLFARGIMKNHSRVVKGRRLVEARRQSD